MRRDEWKIGVGLEFTTLCLGRWCKAHETARCVSEQGKVWAYHDALFAHAPQTSPEQLKASAQDVGLDLPAFEPCVSSGKYQTTVATR